MSSPGRGPGLTSSGYNQGVVTDPAFLLFVITESCSGI